jgi:hypothetical protein
MPSDEIAGWETSQYRQLMEATRDTGNVVVIKAPSQKDHDHSGHRSDRPRGRLPYVSAHGPGRVASGYDAGAKERSQALRLGSRKFLT